MSDRSLGRDPISHPIGPTARSLGRSSLARSGRGSQSSLESSHPAETSMSRLAEAAAHVPLATLAVLALCVVLHVYQFLFEPRLTDYTIVARNVLYYREVRRAWWLAGPGGGGEGRRKGHRLSWLGCVLTRCPSDAPGLPHADERLLSCEPDAHWVQHDVGRDNQHRA